MPEGIAYGDIGINYEVTKWDRPEDGAWRPPSYLEFWFVTTVDSNLWALQFNDITDPVNGGSVKHMAQESNGLMGFDNIAFQIASPYYLYINKDGAGESVLWRLDTDITIFPSPVRSHFPLIFNANLNVSNSFL